MIFVFHRFPCWEVPKSAPEKAVPEQVRIFEVAFVCICHGSYCNIQGLSLDKVMQDQEWLVGESYRCA